MVGSLPTMVHTHIKEQVKKQVPEQVRDQVPVYVAEGIILERQKTKEEMERMIAKAILQERVASDDLRDALSVIFGLSELKEITSDEELEEPIEDHPLPTDASSTALSLGYIADFDPEEDEEDPEEDPADYPADGGDNYDNESSNDDDDDDDVEEEEEEEQLSPADPSAVSTYDLVPLS
ncbi:hypothetical protein Tco_0034038 [Tanacetum coccineum]